MENVGITDGRKTTVPKDYYIIEAAKVDIDIPTLCYDPNLEIVGACRLCLVEKKIVPNRNCLLYKAKKEW